MNLTVKPFFECDHCGKKLTTQARLDKHNCEAKKRHDFLRTIRGKSAYYCYKTWMNLRGFAVKDIEVFQNSPYYNSIIEFIKFCNRVGIPDRKHYIQYMIDKGLLPANWTKMDTYTEYLNYFDSVKTPLEMATITMDTLYDLTKILECELNEIFEHMTTSDIMKLVTARKLSPWILLFSTTFMNHMRFDTTPEQRILVSTVINHKYWSTKFKNNPEAVDTMKKIVHELKI